MGDPGSVDAAALAPTDAPSIAAEAPRHPAEAIDTLETRPAQGATATPQAADKPSSAPGAAATLSAETQRTVDGLLSGDDGSLGARMDKVYVGLRMNPDGEFNAEQRRALALGKLGDQSFSADPAYLADSARTELAAQLADPATRRGTVEDITAAVTGELISVEEAEALLGRARGGGAADDTILERFSTTLAEARTASSPVARNAVLGRALVATRLEATVDGEALPSRSELRDLARANPERAFELLTARLSSYPRALELATEVLVDVDAGALDTPAGRALRAAIVSSEGAFPGPMLNYAERWGDAEIQRFGQAIDADPATAMRTLARNWERFGADPDLQRSLRGIARTKVQAGGAETFRRGMFLFSEPPWNHSDVEALQADPISGGTVNALARFASGLRPAQHRAFIDATLAAVERAPNTARTLVPFAAELIVSHVSALSALAERGAIPPQTAATVFSAVMGRSGPAAAAARAALESLDLSAEVRGALTRYADGLVSGVELTDAGEEAVDIARAAHLPRNGLQALRDFGFTGDDAQLQSLAARLRASGLTLDDITGDLALIRTLETLPPALREELTGPEPVSAAAPGVNGYVKLAASLADNRMALEIATANGDPAEITAAQASVESATAALDARRREIAAVGERLPTLLAAAEASLAESRAALERGDRAVSEAVGALDEHATAERTNSTLHWLNSNLNPFSPNYLEEEQADLVASIDAARAARAGAQAVLDPAEARANALRMAERASEFETAAANGTGAAHIAFDMWQESQRTGVPVPPHIADYLSRNGEGFDLGAWQALHSDNPDRFQTDSAPELITGRGADPDAPPVVPGAPEALGAAVDLALSGGSGEIDVALVTIPQDPRIRDAAATLGATLGHMSVITRLMDDPESRTLYDDPVAALKEHAQQARTLLQTPELPEDLAAARAELERLRPQMETLGFDDPQRREYENLTTTLGSFQGLLEPDHPAHRVLDATLANDFVGRDFWGVAGTDGVDFGIQIGTMVAGATVGVGALALAAPSGGTSLGVLPIVAGAFGAATVGVALDEAASEGLYHFRDATGLEFGRGRSFAGEWAAGDGTTGALLTGYARMSSTNFAMQTGVGLAARAVSPVLERGVERFLGTRYAGDPEALSAAMERLQRARTAAGEGPTSLRAYLNEVGEESVQEFAEAAVVAGATQLAGDEPALAGLLAPVAIASAYGVSMNRARARAIDGVGAGLVVDGADIQQVREAYDRAGFEIVNVVDTGDGIEAFVGVAPTGQRVLAAGSDPGIAALEANLRQQGATLGDLESVLQEGPNGVAFLRSVQRSAAAEQLGSLARELESRGVPFDDARPQLERRWAELADSWNSGTGGGQDRGVVLDRANVPGLSSDIESLPAFRSSLDREILVLSVRRSVREAGTAIPEPDGGTRDASAAVVRGRRTIDIETENLTADELRDRFGEEYAHHVTYIDPDSELSFAETGYKPNDPAYNLEGEAAASLVVLRDRNPDAYRTLMADPNALESHIAQVATRYAAAPEDVALNFRDASAHAATARDRILQRYRDDGGSLGTESELRAPTVNNTIGLAPAATSNSAPSLLPNQASNRFAYDGGTQGREGRQATAVNENHPAWYRGQGVEDAQTIVASQSRENLIALADDAAALLRSEDAAPDRVIALARDAFGADTVPSEAQLASLFAGLRAAGIEGDQIRPLFDGLRTHLNSLGPEGRNQSRVLGRLVTRFRQGRAIGEVAPARPSPTQRAARPTLPLSPGLESLAESLESGSNADALAPLLNGAFGAEGPTPPALDQLALAMVGRGHSLDEVRSMLRPLTEAIQTRQGGGALVHALTGTLDLLSTLGIRRSDAPLLPNTHEPGATAVNSASLAGVRTSELQRIQTFANEYGVEIWLVGSRARNAARPESDFDYVVVGGNRRSRERAATGNLSLPRGVPVSGSSGIDVEAYESWVDRNRVPGSDPSAFPAIVFRPNP